MVQKDRPPLTATAATICELEAQLFESAAIGGAFCLRDQSKALSPLRSASALQICSFAVPCV